MKKQFKYLFFVMILLCSTPCMAAPLHVTVSIAPLKYFTEKIGGNNVEVMIMVPAGASPATYEPKPRQMAALTKSEMFIAIGVPFERAWLPRMQAANPDMKVVKALAGVELMQMKSHHHDADGHADGGEEGLPDPHVWTSPKASKALASTILSSLVQADPERSLEYKKNYNELLAEIVAVDSDLKKMLAGKQGTRFLTYHPSWGYFARDYGLVQIPVELEGKEPGPRELAQVIRMAKKSGIKVVFAQPQFSEKSARIVANAIGGTVVFADPLSEDWANNLRKVAESIRDSLR